VPHVAAKHWEMNYRLVHRRATEFIFYDYNCVPISKESKAMHAPMSVNSTDAVTSLCSSSAQRILLDLGFGMLVLLFAFSFVSKAAISIGTVLSYLLALIALFTFDRKLLKREPLLLYFLLPLGVGTATVVFSMDGPWLGLADFLSSFKFFFIPFALAILLRDDQRVWWLFAVALASAVVATTYGFMQPEQHNIGRFTGILVVGRNADMLLVTILACIVFLDDPAFRRRHPKVSVLIVFLVLMMLAGLLLSAIRGAWLGLAIGLVCYALFFNRKWIIPFVVVVVAFVLIDTEGPIFNEIISIVDTNNNNSNNARLQLWRTSIDFIPSQLWIGAGSISIAELYVAFFNAQSVDYQQTYSLAGKYPGDFHNSFIQILAEWGLPFFTVLMVCGILLSVKLVQALKVVRPDQAVFIRVFVVTSVGFLSAQFFHGELYSYGAPIYFLIVYKAMRVSSRAAEIGR
jgi:O-antigen ligase